MEQEIFPEKVSYVAPITSDSKIQLPPELLAKYLDIKPGDKYNLMTIQYPGEPLKLKLFKSKSEVVWHGKIPKDYKIQAMFIIHALQVNIGDLMAFEYDGEHKSILIRRATNEIK